MLSLSLLVLAVVCLSLSMPKHYKDCFKRSLKDQWLAVWKILAWGLLFLSLYLMPQTGISYVYWCCQLSALILLQAGSLAVIKRRKHKRSKTKVNRINAVRSPSGE